MPDCGAAKTFWPPPHSLARETIEGNVGLEQNLLQVDFPIASGRVETEDFVDDTIVCSR